MNTWPFNFTNLIVIYGCENHQFLYIESRDGDSKIVKNIGNRLENKQNKNLEKKLKKIGVRGK